MSKDVIFFMDVMETLPTKRNRKGEDCPDKARASYLNRRAEELTERGYVPRLVMVSSLRKVYDRGRAEKEFKDGGLTLPLHDDWRICPTREHACGVPRWLRAHALEVAAFVIMDDNKRYGKIENLVVIPTYAEEEKFKGFRAREVDAAFKRFEVQLNCRFGPLPPKPADVLAQMFRGLQSGTPKV